MEDAREPAIPLGRSFAGASEKGVVRTGRRDQRPVVKKLPIAGRASRPVAASQIHSEASVESSFAPTKRS